MNNVRTSVAGVGAFALLILAVGVVLWWQSSGFSSIESTALLQEAPAEESTSGEQAALNQELIRAIGQGDSEALATALADGADANAESSPGRPALYLAAKRGNADAVRMLIDSGADVNADTLEGAILVVATVEGHLDIVDMLLDAGVDIDAIGKAWDGGDASALWAAAENRHADVARLLVERGADVNAVDAGGVSVLMIAAGTNQPDLVSLLLENGADIDHQAGDGSTALHGAALHPFDRVSSPEAAQVLIDQGAALDIENNEGQTPLDVALPDVAELLRAAGTEGTAGETTQENQAPETALDESTVGSAANEAAEENPAAEAPAPTAVPEEFLVSSEEDLVGDWYTMFGPEVYELSFRAGGRLRWRFPFSSAGGTYYFDGDQLMLDSQQCLQWVITGDADSNYGGEQQFVACTASYTAYATRQGEEIVKLRFELIEDADSYRSKGMPGNTWKRVEE